MTEIILTERQVRKTERAHLIPDDREVKMGIRIACRLLYIQNRNTAMHRSGAQSQGYARLWNKRKAKRGEQ